MIWYILSSKNLLHQSEYADHSKCSLVFFFYKESRSILPYFDAINEPSWRVNDENQNNIGWYRIDNDKWFIEVVVIWSASPDHRFNMIPCISLVVPIRYFHLDILFGIIKKLCSIVIYRWLDPMLRNVYSSLGLMCRSTIGICLDRCILIIYWLY